MVVRAKFKRFTDENKAIFPAIGEEKTVVDVLIDISCSSCRKLVLEVPRLQAAGISVQYLPYADEDLDSPGL